MSWQVRAGYDPNQIVSNGNKFLLANGYMGYRGTMEEYGAEQLAANTILGLYDQVGDKWREPVNAPNGLFFKLFDQATEISLLTLKPSFHQQTLDYQQGLHIRKTAFSYNENTITLQAERFLHMKRLHLMADEITLAAEKPITLQVKIGIDTAVWDINGPHLINFETEDLADQIILSAKTQREHKNITVAQAVNASKLNYLKKEGQFAYYEVTLTPEPITFHIFATTFNANDCQNPKEAAKKELDVAFAMDFASLKKEHTQIWKGLWEKADVEIDGDSKAQEAIRYSLYHLLSIAPRHSDTVSIPARGLSGQTYKGAIFWDTEMFMLPFFMHVLPEVAKNILSYRIYTLPGALAKAKEYGFNGAFYAWESQELGQDATSDYNVVDVFTKRPMRTYFRDKQIHISGDIAYAFWQYYEYTKDLKLLLKGGAQVIFECAKFYYSYAYYKVEKNRFELIDVIGPDEYHERVYNNAYTNKLAQKTMKIALDLWEMLAENAPEDLAEILTATELMEIDKEKFQRFYNEIYVPQPNDAEIIEQFDNYFSLEDVSVEAVRKRLLDDKEYWGGAYGVAADTQVIKQADVIFMLHLFGEDYTKSEIQKNWEYYEPRTEHGSSLSACIYALVACQFDNQDWAYPYFMKTATVDLTGETKQYAGTIYIGGTHPAANGGAWLAAIKGFGGLSVKNNQLQVTPKLPKSWQRLAFNTIFNGESYHIEIEAGKTPRISKKNNS